MKSAHQRARDKAGELDELMATSNRWLGWHRDNWIAHVRRVTAELRALLLEADAEVADAFDSRRAPRACSWCRAPIPADARVDATTCSQKCRQAKYRGGTGRKVRPWPAAITRPRKPATSSSATDIRQPSPDDWHSPERRAQREQLEVPSTAQPSTAERDDDAPRFRGWDRPAVLTPAAVDEPRDASRGTVTRSSSSTATPTTPKQTQPRKDRGDGNQR